MGTCLPREQRAGRRLESYGEESGRTAMFFRLSDPKTRARILISSMLLFFLISERQSGFFRYYYFFLINLFIYLFLAVLGLRFCARAFSSCGERGPLFIAVCGPLTIVASLIAEHRLLTHRLSSCGLWAQLLHGMWDLPGPGLESWSRARIRVPCIGRRIPNHCATREALDIIILKQV